MKNIYVLVAFLVTILFVSCKDESIDMGMVSYHSSFLWSEAETVPLVKTYEFDFSEDAKHEPECYAEFIFVDNEEKPIDQDEMIVWVDGQKTKDNTFRVNSKESSKEVKFVFTERAEGGKYQGYLKLINHKLHRIDNTQLQQEESVPVFQWTIRYDKRMNPLAKVLVWIVSIVSTMLFLWFVFFRQIFYPQFKKITKTVLIRQNGQIVGQTKLAFKGARMVVFTNKTIKQSFWNRLFMGKIKFLEKPFFTENLTFVPRRKNAQAYGEGYVIEPNPIPQSGMATIKNVQQKLEINLS
ncbi:MAG: hypothetical protein WCQ55_01195 [Paludibacteraceae bacterium]